MEGMELRLLQMCCLRELVCGPVKITSQCVFVCVCMSPAHNLLFLPAATVVPLSYCFCFEKHSHMCLSPDNKFIADFQSIICTERTISADKTPQLITAAAECVPTQLRCMKTKQFCHCHLHLIVRNAVLVRPAGCVDTWFVV